MVHLIKSEFRRKKVEHQIKSEFRDERMHFFRNLRATNLLMGVWGMCVSSIPTNKKMGLNQITVRKVMVI